MAKSVLFLRIAGYLGDKYEESDGELIQLYCETHAFYRRMRSELKKSKSLLLEYTNKSGATNEIKHPLASEITKTVQVLNNLLKSLGLTAAQRKKAMESKQHDDDFDDF